MPPDSLSHEPERQLPLSVALTGASGFVGHHLAVLLQRRGDQVTALLRPTSRREKLLSLGIRCIDAPLNDLRALREGVRGCQWVFHLASAVDFAGDWSRFHQVNVIGTRNVIQACRLAGVGRLIHTSSIVAVGASSKPFPMDETTSWNLGPLQIPYVTTKRQAEEEALAAAGENLEVVVVNPACVIGPEDFSQSEFGTLCKRFWRGRVPFHFGGGHNYVDVRDVAWGHLRAAQKGRSGQRYLLGGTNWSALDFFAELARFSRRSIFRLRLPNALGPIVAWFDHKFNLHRPARSYLTPAQAKLLPWFFYYDSSKAEHELGYQIRPWRQTLADTYSFWMGKTCLPSGPTSACA